MASICMSIGGAFGSLVHVPELGIVMNNAMQNFDPRPDHPNAIKPGKMPVFAAPGARCARQGEGRFAGAGAGGYRTETAVLHAFMNVIDHRMRIQRAIDHPRVHCQGRRPGWTRGYRRSCSAASSARATTSWSWTRIRGACTSAASPPSPGSRGVACCVPARGRCGALPRRAIESRLPRGRTETHPCCRSILVAAHPAPPTRAGIPAAPILVLWGLTRG